MHTDRENCAVRSCSKQSCAEKCASIEQVNVDSLDFIIKHICRIQKYFSLRNSKAQNLSPDQQSNFYKTFELQSSVQIDLEKYQKRIHNYAEFDNAVYIFAQQQVEKSTCVRPEQKNSFCFHKLFIASLTQATKLTEDKPQGNKTLSKIFGISTNMLSDLEMTMLLDLFQGKILINEEDFNEYQENMINLA